MNRLLPQRGKPVSNPPVAVEMEKPKNDGDVIVEAVKLLCEINVPSSTYHHHHHRSSTITDEQKLKHCGLLLRRCPATRPAVLGTMSKCIEKHVRRMGEFKKSLDDMRQSQYNAKNDDNALKATIGELHQLVADSPAYWAAELATWAISSVANIGAMLGANLYPSGNLTEVTSFWMNQEITAKLSHIIVSGVLFDLERADGKSSGIMETLMKQALFHQPYLDWILACISISKPKLILSKLLESGFHIFMCSDRAEEKKQNFRALTCILEYLVEKKPELVAQCLVGLLKVNEQKTLLIQSLYILELLESSLNSNRIELIYKIGTQVCAALTPQLITELHRQKKETLAELDMESIKSSIAAIMSGSGSLDITRVFVAISNGDGEYGTLELEIRLVFKSILGAILNKLEDGTFDNVIVKIDTYSVPPNLNVSDPTYRLLRLIIFNSNQQTAVDAIVKVLTSVNTPQGQAALLQLLKESHLLHPTSFIEQFVTASISKASNKLALCENLYILIEESKDDAGQALLSSNIRATLIDHIAHLMELIDGAEPELIKAGLRLITRLNLGANHSSNMLLIETLMKLFFGSIDLDLAATTWSLLVKLSNSDSACYALIVRKTIETLRRISQPPVPTCKKQENTSLLDQVQSTASASSSCVMGRGQIGDGVKRIRITSDEQEKLAETNYTIALFIATLLKEKAEFDRVNTLAGFLKEHFCSSLAIGSEWPKPVSRGQTRPGLERDIMLVKALPANIYSLLDLLTSDWRALYRVSSLLRAQMNKLLAWWESSRYETTAATPEQLKESIQVVTLLGKARIIPAIIAETTLMYEFVSPYDLFLLMNAVWGFLNCNPINQTMVDTNFDAVNVDLFLQDARNILLKHIDKTAHLYHKFY